MSINRWVYVYQQSQAKSNELMESFWLAYRIREVHTGEDERKRLYYTTIIQRDCEHRERWMNPQTGGADGRVSYVWWWGYVETGAWSSSEWRVEPREASGKDRTPVSNETNVFSSVSVSLKKCRRVRLLSLLSSPKSASSLLKPFFTHSKAKWGDRAMSSTEWGSRATSSPERDGRGTTLVNI